MPTSKAKKIRGIPLATDKFDVHPDTVDFRDTMFVPTLVEVPTRITLSEYKVSWEGSQPRVLDQGREGACTGFGLAAVANYLLHRRRVVPDRDPVSARMLYEMARRYDEWRGVNYSGSSARGAMKGWHKHGVCSEAAWPFDPDKRGGILHEARATDAAKRPLGAYFRVNHKDLVAMHSALAEVRILFATATVHEGWGLVGRDGVIPHPKPPLGGHAFAIVGYDQRGFWIQNSWGESWGAGGFALITYEDWLAHGNDVWVARLGAPVITPARGGGTRSVVSSDARVSYSFAELRPHVISIGNDGALRTQGMFGNGREEVREIVKVDLPRITGSWKTKRLLLYAHGGLVGESNALQRVEGYRQPLLDAGVYPLAFIWRTDLWTTMTNILRDAVSRRRPEGFLDAAKDFLLDRLDDTLEPIARPLGRPVWEEMKENGMLATTGGQGGARHVLSQLKEVVAGDASWEIHIAGHSAGSIFMAPIVQWLQRENLPIQTLTLWAPACTMTLFKEAYLPALRNGAVRSFALFTLKDAAEQDDDCAKVYNKSLLYLVSNALEEKSGLFFADGEPLLGMEHFLVEDKTFRTPSERELRRKDPAMVPILGLGNAQWIRSPNSLPKGGLHASHSRRHGDFDDDQATVQATLARILGQAGAPSKTGFNFARSASSLGDARRRLVP